MIVMIASTILHESSGKPIPRCMRKVSALAWESMKGVYPSNSIVACLGDESFPERNSSFSAFEHNCRHFLKLFERFMNEGSDSRW